LKLLNIKNSNGRAGCGIPKESINLIPIQKKECLKFLINMKKKIIGIILAAGSGNRLQKYNKPKGTINIKNNLSILDNIINIFRKKSIFKFKIITGFKSNLLIYPKAEKIYNKKWKSSNMISSLICAEKTLQKNSCVVSYSEIYYEHSAISKLINCNDDIAICYYSKWKNLWIRRFRNPLIDAETFKIDKKFYLTEIGNKPKTIKEIKGQYMGIIFFKPSGWKKIKRLISQYKFLANLSVTELFSFAIKKKIKIKAIKYDDLFFEIDTKKDLDVMRHDLKNIKIS
jgi:choline kinase